MSILADYEIKRLCVPPTYIKSPLDSLDDIGSANLVSSPYTAKEEFYLKQAGGEAYSSERTDWTLSPAGPAENYTPMITPFHDHQIRQVNGSPVISYGLSSYGYDITIAPEYKIFTNVNNSLLDPKNVDPSAFVDTEGPYCIIPPNSFALARTVEYFDIPDDIIVIALGKSTYARLGVQVIVTPIEPGFKGNVVVEFINGTPLPVKIYANEGVGQFLFLRGNRCLKPYDSSRKYQGQTGITLPRM